MSVFHYAHMLYITTLIADMQNSKMSAAVQVMVEILLAPELIWLAPRLRISPLLG